MKRIRLGMRLYQSSRTPSIIKKLIRLRWDCNGARLERKYRLKSPDNIFHVPFNDGKLFFDLPDHGDLISRHIIVNKCFFECEYLESLRNLIINPSCILDVGANIGNHTLFFMKTWPEARVFSFEPQKDIYNQMRRNLELNKLPTDGCFNVAIGNATGRGSIVYDGRTENNIGATRIDYYDEGEFRIITLDNFIWENQTGKVDLVKIDVEGFEPKVLEGMKKLIEEHNPLIWIEILPRNKGIILEKIQELGLSMVDIHPFNSNRDFLFRKPFPGWPAQKNLQSE